MNAIKKILTIILLFFGFSAVLYCQIIEQNGQEKIDSLLKVLPVESKIPDDDTTITKKYDVAPVFKGKRGEGFNEWVRNHLNYPLVAQEKRIEGRVSYSFVISRKGEISNFKILRSPHPALSREVEITVKASPRWTPAMVGNIPVNVRLISFVIFKLRNK